jgi:hypothetical protein
LGSVIPIVGGRRVQKVVVGEVNKRFSKAWICGFIDFLISVDYLTYYE